MNKPKLQTLSDIVQEDLEWMRNTPEGREHADFVIRLKQGRLTEEETTFVENLEREWAEQRRQKQAKK